MKIFLIILTCLTWSLAQAQFSDPASNADHLTNTPSVSKEQTTIAGDITKLTIWSLVKNPFRFEIQTEHHEVNKYEQIEVTGLTKMPDEDNILQTYVFLIKTSQETSQDQKGRAQRQTETTTTALKAFPQILSAASTPTIEDAEHCSITLTREQLWFIGAMPATNGDMVAIFWQAGPYPVKSSDLKYFTLTDNTLKTLNIRETKLGEKISLTKDPDLLSRLTKYKHQDTNSVDELPPQSTNSVPTVSATTTKTNTPASNIKSAVTPSGDPVKDVEKILE